jgi:predicted P-loop ATPase
MMKKLMYSYIADATRLDNWFHILWGHSQIRPLLSIYSVTLRRPFTRKWKWYRSRLVPWGRRCSVLEMHLYDSTERCVWWTTNFNGKLATEVAQSSDFQLWGAMKASVYKDNPHSLHLLKEVNKNKQTNKQTNSMALVRKRTIPTELPPLVGEVSANFSA